MPIKPFFDRHVSIEEIVENREKPSIYSELILSKSRRTASETICLVQGPVKITLVILAFAQVYPKSIRVFYPQGS